MGMMMARALARTNGDDGSDGHNDGMGGVRGRVDETSETPPAHGANAASLVVDGPAKSPPIPKIPNSAR
jgi:hypothetical protein